MLLKRLRRRRAARPARRRLSGGNALPGATQPRRATALTFKLAQIWLAFLGVDNPSYAAFIDESGQRSRRGKSSPHFVMSAVVIPTHKFAAATEFLADLRRSLGRRDKDVLHWKNYNQHDRRLSACREVASRPDLLRICSVVACKDHLPPPSPGFGQDMAYLYTLRFLLERLSWLSRDSPRDGGLAYTLAHVVRFPMWKLRDYENRLRFQPTNISWEQLDPSGGRIDQPSRAEFLQLADLAASATAAAFNPRQDDGTTNRQYITELAPVLYRRLPTSPITSYGLKMHPWNETTRAAYPWAAAL